MAAPNQIEPQRASCSPNQPRASGGNSAADASAAIASATGGPSSQASGGEMHAVRGRVMAAVPLAVPDREALLAEQVGAEGVGGEVDGARLPDQVGDVNTSATTIGAAFHGSMPRSHRAARRPRPERGGDGAVSSDVVTGEEGGAVTADGASRSTKGQLRRTDADRG